MNGELQPRSRLLPSLEAVFPLAAAQAYIWLQPHDRPRWLDLTFGVAVALIVAAYVCRHGPVSWRAFGLARNGDHRRALVPLAMVTLVGVGLLLAWGAHTSALRQSEDIGRALLGYPVWGLVQQALMLGVLYPRLRNVAGPVAAPALTAFMFALAHSPNPLLMAGGFCLMLAYAVIWQVAPSLPLVAISHGIIGAVADKALHLSMRVGAHYYAG